MPRIVGSSWRAWVSGELTGLGTRLVSLTYWQVVHLRKALSFDLPNAKWLVPGSA